MNITADQNVLTSLAQLLRRDAQQHDRPASEYAARLKAVGLSESAAQKILPLLDLLSSLPVTQFAAAGIPPDCAIDWKPSVLLPVFAGNRHYDTNTGAPGPLQVFFPSLDPFEPTFLTNCGGYPLVIFLHGNCKGDSDHYKRWFLLPYEIARSGYIVVAPRMPGITNGTAPFGQGDLQYAIGVLDWMHTGWEHRDYIAHRPGTAVVGHSFGAILGGRLTIQIQAAAYVDLSGGFNEWISTEPPVVQLLRTPGLYTWGSGDDGDAALDDTQLWDSIQPPKHKLVFNLANHFDYLYMDLPCPPGKGPCSLVPRLAADYATLFLSRYAPPIDAGIDGLIPPTLVPPTVIRSPLQEFFATGHLAGIALLPMYKDSCAVSLEIEPQYLFDWTANFQLDTARSAPTTCVNPGIAASNIAYRDRLGNLREVWHDSQGGFGTTNLTGNAHASSAFGNPFAYIDTARKVEVLLYRDSDGIVQSLHWSTGSVGHDNLSGTAGAPPTDGDPVGYYQPAGDTHHVIYRTSNGHLHELWWPGIAPVQYGGDLVGIATPPAPPSAGQPAAFIEGDTLHNVIYRSRNDSQIRRLFWTTGAVTHENLSSVAGTPPAVGDPTAYYTAHDDVKQIVYAANDGHIWELYWLANSPVAGWDVMSGLVAPAPDSALAAYYVAATNTKHVIYRAGDELHELRWVAGTMEPQHVNLSSAYGLPKAVNAPSAFIFGGTAAQHIAFRGDDNHIYELLL
jgi:hypothetical protein